MQKTAVVTDSNSGITQEIAKKMGIFVLPMTFFINGKQYYEEINLTQEEFFRRIEDPNTTVSTSQPSPGEVMALWDEVLKSYEEIVYIPMSSSLSASCQTAMTLAEEYDGKVQVVNNQRISVTQERSVKDALALVEAGYSAREVKDRLEAEKYASSIYIMVDSLKYLKKGGRITPSAALIGSVLNIKPVLTIQGEKLDAFAKCRGIKGAKKSMLAAMHHDFETRFAGEVDRGEMELEFSFTHADQAFVSAWKQEIENSFPGFTVYGAQLSISIACHTGPGCLAIAASKKIVP